MNTHDHDHPGDAEWAAFLWRDDSAADGSDSLAGHLRHCSRCRARISAWKDTLGRLDAWEIDAFGETPSLVSGGRRNRWSSGIKAAAVVALCVGLGLGLGAFLTGRRTPSDETYAELEAQLRARVSEEVRLELAVEMHAAVESGLQQIALAFQEAQRRDRQMLLTLMEEGGRKYRADFLALRRDLETVATAADDEFALAHDRILRLTSVRASSRVADVDPGPESPSVP